MLFRIIRGIIGAALAFGLLALFGNILSLLGLVRQIDLSTNWFFNWALPLGISCFLCMGILPILFTYTFLSSSRPTHAPLEESREAIDPELSDDDIPLSPKRLKRGLTALREVASDDENAPSVRKSRNKSKEMSV